MELYEVVLTVNTTGKDPMVFLTNGTRIALKLEGPSDRPQSVVQAAQDAYYEELVCGLMCRACQTSQQRRQNQSLNPSLKP